MPRKATAKRVPKVSATPAAADPVADAYAAGQEAGKAYAREGTTLYGKCPHVGAGSATLRKAWLAGVNESLSWLYPKAK